MKKFSVLLLVAILAVGQFSVRGEEKKDVASDVKALDMKLTEAFKARDFKLIGRHTDDEYTLVDPRGGIHDKKAYLKYLTDSTSDVKDLKETDVKVRVFGETAVVTGLLHVKGKYKEKEINPEYRWTRVYNKKGEDWICVFEQHTYVVPKEEEKK
jgi:ketosteroid isomerase-like protein